MLDLLARFPFLHAAYVARAASPPLPDCYVGDLLAALRDHEHDYGVGRMESLFAGLSLRFSREDLAEQVDDVFSVDQDGKGEERWEKALTELHTFAYLAGRGLLHGLGWPPGYGDKAPFDCRLTVAAAVVAADVKPAAGSGYFHLKGGLRRLADPWRQARGLGPLDVELHYDGALTRQAVGPLLRDPARTAAFVGALGAFPTCPAGPVAIPLPDGGSVRATIHQQGSARAGGGTQFVDPVVDSLAPTLAKHASGKAKSAAAHGAQFLLAYVTPYGYGGSDVKEHTLWQSVERVDAGLAAGPVPEWLGVLYLDFTKCPRVGDAPSVTLFARRRAPPSAPLTADLLAWHLGAKRWDV